MADEKPVRLGSGLETVVRAWRPRETPKAVVVGVHGFAEHSGRYEHFGAYLAEKGFSLYMYDLRGHGLSKSERGYVESFNDFVRDTISFISYVKEEARVPRVFLFGHSMGGLIAVHVAGALGEELRGLVTSGAALEVRTTFTQRMLLSVLGTFSPRKRLPLPVSTECLTHDEEVAKRYLSDPLVFKDPTVRLLVEFGRGVSQAWRSVESIKCPALVLHGKEDCLVPPSASQRLYEKLRVADKTLKLYEGLKHEILNEPQWRMVADDIARWLEEHL